MANPPLILCVDDDKDFCQVLSDKLTSKGFAVKSARGGTEGLELAKKHDPALILMDVQMPDKDGIATTMDLQQDPKTKHIKVIFVSNLGDSWPSVTEVNRRLAQQIGAHDYFKKGGDLDVLVEKIRQLLSQSK